MWRPTASIPSLIVLSAVVLAAQAVPQFRTGVQLLQLDVIVLDGQRRPVRGLNPEDFTVLDNGVETPIRAFTSVDLPPVTVDRPAWDGEVAPDVVTNEVVRQDGRLVVIMLDRSIPAEQPTTTARRVAARVVESLGPHDLAAVVSSQHNAVQGRAVQNFTADRQRLLRAINAIDPSTRISAEALAIMNKYSFLDNEPLNDPSCLCGLCVLETITRVADALPNAPRRQKLLVFVGSDLTWQSYRAPGRAFADTACERPIADARTRMFSALDRVNMVVHSVDPQGLVNPSREARGSSLNWAPRRSLDGAWAGVAGSAADRENIKVLPERTGGRVVAGSNDPEDAIPAILNESSSYYVIGIERAASSGADADRAIEIKAGRKGVRVVAQRRYAGTAGADTPGVAVPARSAGGALHGLLPRGDIPLSLVLIPFASPDTAKNMVRASIDIAAFVPSDGSAVPLAIELIAVDRVGRTVASARQTSTVAARRPARDVPFAADVQSHLSLTPGDFEIRVAVTEAAANKVASVFSDVTVPDFAQAPLSLSGISVEPVGTGGSGASASTTRRRFARTEQVRTVLQIYQGTQRTDALVPVTMRVQVLDVKGATVHEQSLTYPDSAFTNRRAGAALELPLARLREGDHLLRLTASAKNQTASRTMRFTVK